LTVLSSDSLKKVPVLLIFNKM